MTKEQIIKLIENKIDNITELSIECFEQVYLAAWNEAIETAAKNCYDLVIANNIRKLKKDDKFSKSV